MKNRATADQVEILISHVKKKSNGVEPANIATAMGVSVPTYYMWRAKGMPMDKYSRLMLKFAEAKPQLLSGNMIRPRSDIDPKKRVWVSIACAKCRDEYQIACMTYREHNLPEDQVFYFDFGTFFCPKCTKILCL